MCETCGCGDPEIVPIEVQERILSDNDAQAGHNRSHFKGLGVLAINLMGSPGAGKTAVLEATAKAAGARLKLGAVSGDLATERDADRLNASGIISATITTGSACHLDARLVHHALHHFPSNDRDIFFIENVGNLVCPAIYDLGQAANVVALSVTEGEDKPIKYPDMFHAADLMLLNKVDLLRDNAEELLWSAEVGDCVSISAAKLSVYSWVTSVPARATMMEASGQEEIS